MRPAALAVGQTGRQISIVVADQPSHLFPQFRDDRLSLRIAQTTPKKIHVVAKGCGVCDVHRGEQSFAKRTLILKGKPILIRDAGLQQTINGIDYGEPLTLGGSLVNGRFTLGFHMRANFDADKGQMFNAQSKLFPTTRITTAECGLVLDHLAPQARISIDQTEEAINTLFEDRFVEP